ncbi:MAG: hypothetical protein LBI40_03695 [Treponema sp.]|jgi:hypothetical protein|nr:hypothetical protein [Treponema sp.]
MYTNSQNNNAIPEEYRQIAEALISLEASVEQTHSFADILGIGGDYKKLFHTASPDEIHYRLSVFKTNLNLLIQKTWVEKVDEDLKEKLQDKIPIFIAEIENGEYRKALFDFNNILNDLAFLFFGAQSSKEDFTEYTLRIDTQMGLFWWYGAQLADIKQGNTEYLRALLFIGICYLSNF